MQGGRESQTLNIMQNWIVVAKLRLGAKQECQLYSRIIISAEKHQGNFLSLPVCRHNDNFI